MVAKVLRTPLRRIPVAHGDVLRALRTEDTGFAGFGEAYFSSIERGAVKGWKRHRDMTMNLIVPAGRVRFALATGEPGEIVPSAILFHELSPDDADSYARLTVPPGYWMAFAGLGEGLNLVLNIADRMHDEAEVASVPLESIDGGWSIL